MTSFKKTVSRGFTIVELLIVIVVIGILAGLVVVTYNGIQKKARDTERKTDINALHGQLEAYQAQNGKYPLLGTQGSNDGINDSTWRGTNMKGLDPAALADPNNAASQVLVNAAAANNYAYVAAPANCDNGAGGDCTQYTLTATLEGGGTYEKLSLN